MYTRHIIPSDKYPMRYEGDTRRRESDSLLKVQYKGETQNYKTKEFYDMDRYIKYNEKIMDVDDVINMSNGEYIIGNSDIFGDKSEYDKLSIMNKCNINVITSQTDYLAMLNNSNIIKQYVLPIIYEDNIAKLKTEIMLIENLIYNAENDNMKNILDVIRTALKKKEIDTDDTITLEEFTNIMATYYTEKGSGFDTTTYTTVKAIADAYESLFKRLDDLKNKMIDEYYIPYRSVYPSSDIEWTTSGSYRYQFSVAQNNTMKTAYDNLIPNGTDLPTVPRDIIRYPNAAITVYSNLNEIYTDMIYANTRINAAIADYNSRLPLGLATGISFATLINSYKSIKSSTDSATTDLNAYNTEMTQFIPNDNLDTSKYPTWNEIASYLENVVSSVDNKLPKGATVEEIATYNSTHLAKYPNANAFAYVVKNNLDLVASNTNLKLLPKATYSGNTKNMEDGLNSVIVKLSDITNKGTTITDKFNGMIPTFIEGDNTISTEYTTAYSSLQNAADVDGILISFKTSMVTLNALDAKFENIKLTDPTLSSYRFIWGMV